MTAGQMVLYAATGTCIGSFLSGFLGAAWKDRRARRELVDHIKNCRPYLVIEMPSGKVTVKASRNLICPHKGLR